MRILYVTTVGIMMQFFGSFIGQLLDQGHTVDIATNETNYPVPQYYKDKKCKIYQMEWSRSPLDVGNFKAIARLRRIVQDNHYDIVHCHSPIAAMCTRLACRSLRKKGVKVIYTAHGFHFCKTAPRKNWLMFYPVEWICAWWTDVLITINEDDYALAKKHMHAAKVEYVPGVGIDMETFAPKKMSEAERQAKREELGLKENEKLMLSVGEVNKDKNHILVLEALSRTPHSNYKYCICGEGLLQNRYEEYISEHGIGDKVSLLGYRRDISEILQITDLFVFPSTFEGLPMAVMEAVASRVMVVCSASRGNTDLVKDVRCLFDYRSVTQLLAAIDSVEKMSAEEKERILDENYSRLIPKEKGKINQKMLEIYKEVGEG